MKKSNIILVCFLISFLLSLDLVLKYIVSNYLTSINIIDNFFSLTYVLNDGAAFSLFRGNIYILIIIAIICLFFIIYELKNNLNDRILSIGYSLLLAGLLGNFIDILIDGYVVDYLSFDIFGYGFPVFNIADIGITIGFIILAINILRRDGNEFRDTSNKQRGEEN